MLHFALCMSMYVCLEIKIFVFVFVLVLQRCLLIPSVRIALYIILLRLWLVLIHVELRNCPVPGTKTFGPLPLCSVMSPI